MNVIGVIPARWGARRLPGKCLLPLLGKPLVLWVAEAARRACRLQRLLVATDDERIARTVREAGFEAVMTRADHPSGTDRMAEALHATDADIAINIQGDEPLIDPALIDRLAETLCGDSSWDMATAATAIEEERDVRDPAVVKTVWDRQGRALYFSRAPIPFARETTAFVGGRHWRHIGVYAYRMPFLEKFVAEPPCALEQVEKLEQLRALYLGARIAVVQTCDRGVGVDTPADVQRAEEMLRARQAVGQEEET
jgi:3-deoxy-manno-octulosonate cytidylyltransferase (CMP-KDO synthetase)